MKQLNRGSAGSPAEAVLAFGLRGLRGLLVLTCWALFLVAMIAGGLAEIVGRSAARIRIR